MSPGTPNILSTPNSAMLLIKIKLAKPVSINSSKGHTAATDKAREVFCLPSCLSQWLPECFAVKTKEFHFLSLQLFNGYRVEMKYTTLSDISTPFQRSMQLMESEILPSRGFPPR